MAGVDECTLTSGATYRFRHKRKGEFHARFVDLVPTKPGDPDPYFVHVVVDTGEGSQWAWMANAKAYIDGRETTPKETPKLLRPCLIEGVAEVLELD